ncbi:hypothetical protein [Glaciibacter sp. 2TAF33]|uniref:hypothetical protein n=1 Tax=Glaciibacter sp. 2TAF33 TaxID=3233015 RepID=UPI003F8FE466
MSIVVPLVLAALMLVLLRRFILRRRRMRRGLPVRGPYHFPRWVRELRIPWRRLWRRIRGTRP